MGRHGENIRKRKDGRWEARLLYDHDEQGKARYLYFYGKTYQEVKNKRIKAQTDRESVKVSKNKHGENVRFEEVMDSWLHYVSTRVKESTYSQYSYLCEAHLRPGLGDINVSALNSAMIEQFTQKKLKRSQTGGLSPKTVTDLLSVLKLILKYGENNGIEGMASIPIKSPRNSIPRIKILTRTEQERLEYVILNHPEPAYLGILISLYAGIRIGEMCALRWGDINFEEGILEVRNTVIRVRNFSEESPAKTKVILNEPKSDCSRRQIPLPAFALSYLRTFQKQNSCFILTGKETFMEPRCYLNRYKAILKAHGFEPFNYHVLRHTFATRCIESGFDIKSLSEILGHASVNTTLQRYVHPSMELKKSQMEKLGKISVLGQTNGQPSPAVDEIKA